MPDDELQVMLYIHMLRKLVRHPSIPIDYGMVIYENTNDPNDRKACLVEYSGEIMEKFFAKLAELNECLDRGENIEPYIPAEAHTHSYCQFRQVCPRGIEAGKIHPRKQNKLPLWKIMQLRRREKIEAPKDPGPKVLQGALFEHE